MDNKEFLKSHEIPTEVLDSISGGVVPEELTDEQFSALIYKAQAVYEKSPALFTQASNKIEEMRASETVYSFEDIMKALEAFL